MRKGQVFSLIFWCLALGLVFMAFASGVSNFKHIDEQKQRCEPIAKSLCESKNSTFIELNYYEARTIFDNKDGLYAVCSKNGEYLEFRLAC